MKHVTSIAVLVTVSAYLFFSASCLAAGEKPTPEKGKALFNDVEFAESNNDSSCNSCHLDGKALEKAEADEKLADTINKCIIEKLDGQALSLRSKELWALISYIDFIKGRALFNNPTLGGSTNDKSCNSCHPGGQGLMEAGKKEENLTSNIKRCINGALQGKSEEMDFKAIKLVRHYIWAVQRGMK